MKFAWFFLFVVGGFIPLEGQLILVPQAENRVIIDGIIEPDEWADAISTASISNLTDGSIDGPDDLSGTISLKWDATNLYFLFQIIDDMRSLDSNDGNPFVLNSFNDDSVEVYIDVNATKKGPVDAVSKRFQYRFMPLDGGEIERTPLNGSVAGITFAHQGDISFNMEISIPWSTLGFSDPAIGKTMGFEVGFNDDDDGGIRDAQLFWNSKNLLDWNDASKWGDIQLTGTLASENPNIEVPPVKMFLLNQQAWVVWTEATGFIYQLRHSIDLKKWENDDRVLLSTGNTYYFTFDPTTIEDRLFYSILVDPVP